MATYRSVCATMTLAFTVIASGTPVHAERTTTLEIISECTSRQEIAEWVTWSLGRNPFRDEAADHVQVATDVEDDSIAIEMHFSRRPAFLSTASTCKSARRIIAQEVENYLRAPSPSDAPVHPIRMGFEPLSPEAAVFTVASANAAIRAEPGPGATDRGICETPPCSLTMRQGRYRLEAQTSERRLDNARFVWNSDAPVAVRATVVKNRFRWAVLAVGALALGGVVAMAVAPYETVEPGQTPLADASNGLNELGKRFVVIPVFGALGCAGIIAGLVAPKHRVKWTTQRPKRRFWGFSR